MKPDAATRRRRRLRQHQDRLTRAGVPPLAAYWEARYATGHTSGAGSTGHTAETKALFVNLLIRGEGIRSVVDWGCGDGTQLARLDVPDYLGIDIAPAAVRTCLARHPGRAFMVWPPNGVNVDIRAELALSLDVIFHLVDDGDYEAYMGRLFASATRYVVIHSTDYDAPAAGHMRHRHHTALDRPGWAIVARHDNPTEPGFTVWSRT